MRRWPVLMGTLTLGAAAAGVAWSAAPAPAPPTSVVFGYYQCDRSEVAKVDAFMAEV